MERYRILVKGIIEYDNKYLIVKKWYDDRISEPYQWEFIDGELEFGEKPEQSVVRIIENSTGIHADIERILYTWTLMIGETCNIGIAYLCMADTDSVLLSEDLNESKWIDKDEFGKYIENPLVIEDVENADL